MILTLNTKQDCVGFFKRFTQEFSKDIFIDNAGKIKHAEFN